MESEIPYTKVFVLIYQFLNKYACVTQSPVVGKNINLFVYV